MKFLEFQPEKYFDAESEMELKKEKLRPYCTKFSKYLTESMFERKRCIQKKCKKIIFIY